MKISEVMSMPECHWVKSHLTQYLDRDPSAPLTDAELRRLEVHIALCDKCAAVSEDYRETSKALSQLRTHVDQESINRLSDSLKRLTSGE
ncbi:MAG: zf-HC2 domain-containing protein [Actinobacteria bacterium]|nr:zf-HC2 domain-containing protein [Actinomycetota bacterium]